MRIQDIYQTYYIMPSLQKHQLRVASVARVLCREIRGIEVDTTNIILACLLHDMGNILKFDLDLFPEFLEPEGRVYWQNIQDDFERRYGRDEHVATMEISKEILTHTGEMKKERSKRVLELIDAIGFSNARHNAQHDDFGRKVAAYADMRVEPHGVVSLEKRLEDGRRRFNINKPGVSNPTFFAEMAHYLQVIEGQIFIHTDIDPSDITDAYIATEIPHLLEEEDAVLNH